GLTRALAAFRGRATASGFARNLATLCSSSGPRDSFGLARDGLVRCRRPALALQCAECGAGTFWRYPPLASHLPLDIRSLGAAAGFLGHCSLLGRGQVHPRLAGFRKPDGDDLLRRSSTVLTLANVMKLLANELTGLRSRRLAFALGLFGFFQRFFFWHGISPP